MRAEQFVDNVVHILHDAVPVRIRREVLPLIVGAAAFSRTDLKGLSRRGQSIVRHSVDINAVPSVHQYTMCWCGKLKMKRLSPAVRAVQI